MSLRLPRWESLSKDEQVPIINLPLGQDLWATGGPGTGKTVMALYRASQALADRQQRKTSGDLVFMIYNKSLRLYLDQALRETGITDAFATTWHKWLYGSYSNQFGSWLPESRRYVPDWSVVAPKMIEHYASHGPAIEHLFLDETQDFPVDLLRILRTAASVISTFSDPNQRIHEESADHNAIGRTLRVATNRYYLTRNYRNTLEIATVADLFRDDASDATPKPPSRTGPKPEAIEADNLGQALEFVARYADNQPELQIGVLVPDFASKEAVEPILARLLKRAAFQAYRNNNDAFTFEQPGVKLMTYDTAKGLEFDTVFLPLVGNEHGLLQPSSTARNRLFVACTRARNELYFLHTPATRSWAMETLVMHDEVVDWYTLRENDDTDLTF